MVTLERSNLELAEVWSRSEPWERAPGQSRMAEQARAQNCRLASQFRGPSSLAWMAGEQSSSGPLVRARAGVAGELNSWGPRAPSELNNLALKASLGPLALGQSCLVLKAVKVSSLVELLAEAQEQSKWELSVRELSSLALKVVMEVTGGNS